MVAWARTWRGRNLLQITQERHQTTCWKQIMVLEIVVCALGHFCEVCEPSVHAEKFHFMQWDLLGLVCGFLCRVVTCYGTTQNGTAAGPPGANFLVVGACGSLSAPGYLPFDF